MPSVVCPIPTTHTYDQVKAAFNNAKKQAPGLTPAAWRKMAAQELGMPYDEFLAVWKTKGKLPVTSAPAPTKPAAVAPTTTMTVTAPPVAQPVTSSALTATKVKQLMTALNIKKQGYTKVKYTASGQMYGGGANFIPGYKTLHKSPNGDVIIEFTAGFNEMKIQLLGKKLASQGWYVKRQGNFFTIRKDPIPDADFKPPGVSVGTNPATPGSATSHAVGAASKAPDPPKAASPQPGLIQTAHGPLDNALAKSVYNKMKKDMPSGTPATWRKAAAQYLGVDYKDYLNAWKAKPGKVPPPSASQLPPNPHTPLVATKANKYADAITTDQLKDELHKLYGPGAKKEYIAITRHPDGSYTTSFPSSILSPVAKGKVHKALEDMGLTVTKTGNTYKMYPKNLKLKDKKAGATGKLSGDFDEDMAKVLKEIDGENHIDAYSSLTREWVDNWWSTISAAQKTAWKRYTGSAYREMNRYLRKGGTISDEMKKWIKDLSASMPKTSERIIVYRGSPHPPISTFTKGGLWTNEGFTSTAVSRGRSWSGVKYEIICPPGTRGMYIDPKSSHQGELEFLLDKGTRFRVMEVDKDKNLVKLVVIPKK